MTTSRHLTISATEALSGALDVCVVTVGNSDGDAIEYARSTIEARVYQGYGPECTSYEVYDQTEKRVVATLVRRVTDHGQTVSRHVRIDTRS